GAVAVRVAVKPPLPGDQVFGAGGVVFHVLNLRRSRPARMNELAASWGQAQRSRRQFDAQPSPSSVLPSSHTSPPSRMPSPQRGTPQVLRQAVESSNASIVIGSVITSGMRSPSSRTQPQVVRPILKRGVTVIFQVPGNGRPPTTPPSLFMLKPQRPAAVSGPV